MDRLANGEYPTLWTDLAFNATFRFYYAQEVSESGGPQSPPDGRTHGQIYYGLYLQKTQGLWHVRFKKGGERWAPPRNR